MQATQQPGAPIVRLAKRVAPGWPFGTVFAAAAAAIILMAIGRVENGLILLGTALLLGSVLRFILPSRHAGLLAVRRRGEDVIAMALLGLSVLGLAVWLAVGGL
jgi:hypothetical protein